MAMILLTVVTSIVNSFQDHGVDQMNQRSTGLWPWCCDLQSLCLCPAQPSKKMASHHVSTPSGRQERHLPLGTTTTRGRLSVDLGRCFKWLRRIPAYTMIPQSADMDFYPLKKRGKGMLIIG